LRDAPAEQEANAPQKASAKGAEARSVAAAITDPVNARVNGSENLQADRERPHAQRIGDDQRPRNLDLQPPSRYCVCSSFAS
jgi:hypothetical protein